MTIGVTRTGQNPQATASNSVASDAREALAGARAASGAKFHQLLASAGTTRDLPRAATTPLAKAPTRRELPPQRRERLDDVVSRSTKSPMAEHSDTPRARVDEAGSEKAPQRKPDAQSRDGRDAVDERTQVADARPAEGDAKTATRTDNVGDEPRDEATEQAPDESALATAHAAQAALLNTTTSSPALKEVTLAAIPLGAAAHAKGPEADVHAKGPEADVHAKGPEADVHAKGALGGGKHVASREAEREPEPTQSIEARLESARLQDAVRPSENKEGASQFAVKRATDASAAPGTKTNTVAGANTETSTVAGARAASATTGAANTNAKATSTSAGAAAPNVAGVGRTTATRTGVANTRVEHGETPERQLEQLMRGRRQEAATSAVNQMTLRQGAEGTVDLGELGTVSVSARTVMGEVDIEVRAEHGDTVSMLQSTSAILEAELRKESIDVRQLGIDKDERDPRHPQRENRGDHATDEEAKRDNRKRQSDVESDFESSVQFVL